MMGPIDRNGINERDSKSYYAGLEQQVEPVSPSEASQAFGSGEGKFQSESQVGFFQLLQKKPQKNSPSFAFLGRKIAADIMTKEVISIHIGTTLDNAWKLMKIHRVSYLPVVKPNGKLVGLISARGLLYANMENRREINPNDTVEKLMNTNVFLEKPGSSARQIVMDLINKKVGVILVAESDKKLLGIITSSDVLKVFFLQKKPLDIVI